MNEDLFVRVVGGIGTIAILLRCGYSRRFVGEWSWWNVCLVND